MGDKLSAAEPDKHYVKDFKALSEFRSLLNSIYTEEQLSREKEKTERLWKEIGAPDTEVLFAGDINGFFLYQLYSIDPILRKFLLYISVPPEAIDLRAKIAKHITHEEMAVHIFTVWLCFGLLQTRLGRFLLFDIVNAVIENYDYFEYVDIYWLVCKVNEKKVPGIAELRKALRRERKFEKGGCQIHEKKRGTLTGATLLRTITEGEKKRYELEIEFFDENNYEAVDEHFVDSYLCGGIELDFPGFSEHFFSQGSEPNSSDELILKCKGKKKEFDLGLLDKYRLALLKEAKNYSFDSEKETQEGDKAGQTSRINIAMEGLFKAAKTFSCKATKFHLIGGIKNNLSEEFKKISTTQDYESRLEKKEYQMRADGLTPGSEEWKNTIGKFKESRGRVLKSKLESSGGSLDREIPYENGEGAFTPKDQLQSTSPSAEEQMIQSEKQNQFESLIACLTEKYPELISKMMSKKPLTDAERKQLQRLRKNPEILKYKEIIKES